jgi:glycosyltransferase involved in cell wall biosynthesis
MKGEILYLGPFNPESVVRERMLPARNPAAFNRMFRLAKALSQVGRPLRIVSTGVSLRIGFCKKLWYGCQSEQRDGIPIVVLPAVGVPVLGFLAEPFILGFWLVSQIITNRPAALMVYNGTLASAFAVVLAWLFRVRVIYEVEDVPQMAFVAASSREKPRLFQNLSWILASRIQAFFCYGVVVPSRRFLQALRLSDSKIAAVISGCMDVTTTRPSLEGFPDGGRPLRVLFAGKLEAEHGYDLLLDAISILIQSSNAASFEFHICGGAGRDSKEFKLPPDHPAVIYHGFVSDEKYRELLSRVDIGLALQKSSGIFRNTRTPSKAYEFLASGKLVIATNVGDLPDLFPHSAICLHPETAADLAACINSIADNPEHFAGIARHGLAEAGERYSFHAAGEALAKLAVSCPS